MTLRSPSVRIRSLPYCGRNDARAHPPQNHLKGRQPEEAAMADVAGCWARARPTVFGATCSLNTCTA